MSSTGSVLLWPYHVPSCDDVTPVTAVMGASDLQNCKIKTKLLVELEFLLAAMSGIVLSFTYFENNLFCIHILVLVLQIKSVT